MANAIKRFFESLVYAGLKPSGGVPAEPRPPRRFGKLREKLDLFLAGGRAPSDPLYLTNRSWKQKLRLVLAIAIPTVVACGVLALVFTHVYAPKTTPPKELTPAEIMTKLLPDLEKTAHIETYKDAEFVELRVVRDGAPRVAGVLKNNTDRVISVEFDLDLANIGGSRVATTTERINHAAPGVPTPFEFPAAHPDAMYALVRQMRTVE